MSIKKARAHTHAGADVCIGVGPGLRNSRSGHIRLIFLIGDAAEKWGLKKGKSHFLIAHFHKTNYRATCIAQDMEGNYATAVLMA